MGAENLLGAILTTLNILIKIVWNCPFSLKFSLLSQHTVCVCEPHKNDANGRGVSDFLGV